MKQDLFKYLHSEIIYNILSRLPIRTIATIKCVSKSWLDLLESDQFVKFYLSRSADALPVLTTLKKDSFLKLEDDETEHDSSGEDETEHYSSREHETVHYSSRCAVLEFEDETEHYNHLTEFDFPVRVTIEGSANGMLLLRKDGVNAEYLYVCNPISHEYIELPMRFSYPLGATYGFGTSKLTGKHKVVCISNKTDHHHVYTLGTGSWRRVEASCRYRCCRTSSTFCALVNGNLHWLASRSKLVSCFDLETECFSTFSVPGGLECAAKEVSALRDCLCVCDCKSHDGKVINIWLMKEYGVEKSWTKEYVINLTHDFRYDFVSPVKIFKNGDVLMVWSQERLFYYSNKTKTTHKLDRYDYIYPVLFTPSLFSLRSFGMEKVISL